jgi:hypothetical protein
MRIRLAPHPDTPSSTALSCMVDVDRAGEDRLRLRYVLERGLDDIALPAASAATRADELWKHTCFEAFFKPAGADGYTEFNFSPSTRWAAYRFDRYRTGMANLHVDEPPIAVQSNADVFVLEAVVTVPGAERLGLSAVIENINGEKSYWAAAHAPGKPDFHHPDSFAIDLRNS